MKKKLLSGGFILFYAILYGQMSVNASGGTVSNASGSISYSIGQVAYTSTSNASGSISQGVQQAYQISMLGMAENTLQFSLSVYPNPTSDKLNLMLAEYKQEKLSYHLYDTEGKKLQSGEIKNQQTILDMENLPTATYFVEVLLDSKQVQLFKILKNH